EHLTARGSCIPRGLCGVPRPVRRSGVRCGLGALPWSWRCFFSQGIPILEFISPVKILGWVEREPWEAQPSRVRDMKVDERGPRQVRSRTWVTLYSEDMGDS